MSDPIRYNDLKKLAETRLIEAKALFDRELFDGSRYLAGYCIELALKARICKLLGLDEYPSGDFTKTFWTHKFDTLIILSGLFKDLRKEQEENERFKSYWSVATKWTEEYRYYPVGSGEKMKVEDLLKAIDDKDNGVLAWIKKHW